MEPMESMDIIRNMIETSKRRIGKRSKYILLWGWAVFITAIVQYILLRLLFPHTYYVWFSMVVTGIVSIIMGMNDRKKETVKTYTGDAIRKLWQSLGFAFVLSAYFSVTQNIQSIPVFLMLYGVGILTTGRIIQFTPLVLGGISCFILAFVSAVTDAGINQLLLLAAAVLLSYIIPGHMLQARYKGEEQ